MCNIEFVAGNTSPRGRKRTSLHNRLAVLRAERGVSRAELATAVGVNSQTIGFLERGDYGPSAELALRIGEFFQLPVEAVFSLRPFSPMSSQLYRPNETGGQP
ncbi:helix-turn-helix transcriptional regulator [Amycolatopsis taiwanensis]|uniref:Transcriptional regulator n=1 Tax=Amycolatopsis taiwanensis TaxID=342230 RepID=A0A9W6VEW6_9PSEU|nr:helix-turn-helix transcriptional regulator [Amycolatopsis taiwanensis]GLY64882.1 transcriptional regulator [Amycolatopsis taiwanensis]